MISLFENNMNMFQADMFTPRAFPPITEWIEWNESAILGGNPNYPYHFRTYRIKLQNGEEHALEISHDKDPGFFYTKVSFIHRRGENLRPDIFPIYKEEAFPMDGKLIWEIKEALNENSVVELPQDLIDNIVDFYKALV